MKENKKRTKAKARVSPISDGARENQVYATDARAFLRSDGKVPSTTKVCIASWNVGLMTGRSAELSEVLLRRHINVCCIQEPGEEWGKIMEDGE